MASLDAKANLSSDSTSSSGLSASELDPLSLPSSSRAAPRFAQHEHYLSPSSDGASPIRIGSKVIRPPVFLRKLITYIRGPSPPIVLRPTPLLDRTYTFRGQTLNVSLETSWIRLTRRLNSIPLFVLLSIAYVISLAFLVRANWFLTPADSFIGCTATFWSAKDGCGLDGQDCMPFSSPDPIQFRCPAACTSTQLLNIRTVGDEEVVYQPLVVGGGDSLQTFRGDSWICLAAIQTGAITNSRGGCASVQLTGEFTSYIGTFANGISSISFPSTFPLSFRILSSSDIGSCTDLRSPALAFNILCTALLFLLLRPKAIILYWSMVCIGYWHITFFSEPRGEPPPISDAFGTFLPTLFVAYAFWLHAFRHVLPFFDSAPLERAVWYLVGFWCGTLFNIVTEGIPIDRLVGSDLSRPGAITALIVIIILVFAIVVNQMRVIRKTGWLPRYLAWHITGIVVIGILAALPTLTLRIHHYIIGILLMAGTAFPTRLSAVFQAFLLGMFLNGVSRWGFDSILQTAAELLRDAPLGSSLPIFGTNASHPLTNLSSTLTWLSIDEAGTTSEGWTGFSLLVDDVERYAGAALNFSLAALQLSEGVPHFFRLAYQRSGTSGDFTKAAVFYPNGTFVDPPPGPS